MSECSNVADCLGFAFAGMPSTPAALLMGSDLMASLISATLVASFLIQGLLLFQSGSTAKL